MAVTVELYTSPTCKPCATFKPVLEAACARFGIPLTVQQVTPHHPAIEKYRIRSVPSTIFLKDGQVVFNSTGVISPASLDETLIDLTK